MAPSFPSSIDGEDDDRFDSCVDYDFRPFPDQPMPTGSAHVSLPATDDLPASEVDLPEATCETLHDAMGNAIGFGASFFSTWESTTFTPEYATVSWMGDFAGDGSYMEARFLHSIETEGFLSRREVFNSGTLTLSEGGRVGSFATDDGGTRITFNCESAAKIATSIPAPAREVPPGTLRIWAESGPVYTYSGIQCGTEASDDFVLTGEFDSPYSVRILFDGNGTGEHRLDDMLLRYAGLSAITDGGRATLECGFPSRGTLEFGGFSDGIYAYTGVFACPE